MIPRGPRPWEGGSDDPDPDEEAGSAEHGAFTPGPDEPAGKDDPGIRGWVPPDARLWRHPSELHAASAPGAGADGWLGFQLGGPTDLSDRRRHSLATALIATGAAAAVVAGVLLLLAAGSVGGPRTATSGSGPTPTLAEATGCCRYVPAAARSALEAMVSLQVTRGSRVDQECGVAVASGGLVATTLDAVAGARSILVVTAGGRRERAVLVATDPDSDVALLRVAGRLSTTRFADRLTTGEQSALVLAMAVMPPSRAASGGATMMWAASTVRSVGADITRGDASGMAGIEAAAPSMPTMGGEMLVQTDGRVVGILDGAASSPTVKVFLPAAFVVGVARTLATSGRVRHGWLDVVGKDSGSEVPLGTGPSATGDRDRASTTTNVARHDAAGVLVVKVEPDGAAASVLRPGDVIVSVDDAPLRSMAELRTFLYLMKPGTRVDLGILREGVPMSVAVDLSASP